MSGISTTAEFPLHAPRAYSDTGLVAETVRGFQSRKRADRAVECMVRLTQEPLCDMPSISIFSRDHNEMAFIMN